MNLLIRYVLELTWSVGKLSADLVGKLDSGDKVADAKTEAHSDFAPGAIMRALRKKCRKA